MGRENGTRLSERGFVERRDTDVTRDGRFVKNFEGLDSKMSKIRGDGMVSA